MIRAAIAYALVAFGVIAGLGFVGLMFAAGANNLEWQAVPKPAYDCPSGTERYLRSDDWQDLVYVCFPPDDAVSTVSLAP